MTYSDNFNKAVKLVLEVEGGLSNSSWDNGGLTKFGISKKAYPNLDIATLTRDQAIQIYHNDYWRRCRCDELPFPLALVVFDSAVNQGTGAAAKFLQLALGVTADGVIGGQTLKAVKSADNKKTLIGFMAERAIRYPDYDDWDVAKRGWMRRLFKVMGEANDSISSTNSAVS
jgi:lysozyme family protein